MKIYKFSYFISNLMEDVLFKEKELAFIQKEHVVEFVEFNRKGRWIDHLLEI